MNRRILEAIAEAMMSTSGYLTPDSPLHAARNPLGLLAFSPSQAKDDDGFRVFHSLLDGLQAGMFDIEVKMSGRSKARLQPASTLSDFAVACGQAATAAQAWARFLKRALRDESISHRTELSYFLGAK